MRKKDSLTFPWIFDPILNPQHSLLTECSDIRDNPQRVIDTWFDVVGPQTAKNARPQAYKQGTLVVRVRNPIWLQELILHKSRLIQDLNRALRSQTVRDIRFEQGILPPSPPPPEEKKAPWQERELSKELLEEIEQKLAHLPETDLKQSARRIMASHFKRTRLKEECVG